MSNTVIKVENIGKLYKLGEIGTGTMSHDLNRWWAKVRGKEDPFAKIGETNDRTSKGESDWVWALRDINFEVKAGEVLGIIGRNGAGKSTLLKILSKVTTPSTGRIKTKGRIASLLEVGTGFHPELTGRENIFLNGAILGMSKAEIKSKFDEIVDFSGVERYIDTPVKRYSSGMYVRLAFAVAAFLEPEILIIDEVLAVGDAEFQKKCLGRMKDVSVNDGRTVLFVSHNMAAVKSLCDTALVLENGSTRLMVDTTTAISYYLQGNTENQQHKFFNTEYDLADFKLHEISVNPENKTSGESLDEYQAIELNTLISIKRDDAESFHVTYVLNGEDGTTLFTFSHINTGLKLKKGLNNLKCVFPKGFLNIGSFYLTLYIIENSKTTVFVEKDIFSIKVQEGERPIGGWMGKEPGFIKPNFKWEISNNEKIN